MRAAFGGLLLAAALAAAPAKADPAPAPPARGTTASTRGGRFNPVQVWGGLGYYRTSVGQPFNLPSVSAGQFGINGGGSYAVPINPEISALAFGNIALAFGDFSSFPITLGGGIRGERVGPVQLSGLAGLSIVPISSGGGTKVGLGLGAQGNYPIPQVLARLGVQAAFMLHILSDSVTLWTINAGLSYTLPY
jgi:hypothetical protein